MFDHREDHLFLEEPVVVHPFCLLFLTKKKLLLIERNIHTNIKQWSHIQKKTQKIKKKS